MVALGYCLDIRSREVASTATTCTLRRREGGRGEGGREGGGEGGREGMRGEEGRECKE